MDHNWLCCLLLLAVFTVRYTLSAEDLKDTSSYDPCECPGGDFSKSCECVYIRNCNDSNYIITQPDDVFTWRANVPLRRKCKGAEICCFVPEDDSGEVEESSTVKGKSTTSTTIRTPPSTKVPEDSGEEGGESSTVKGKSTTSTTIRTPPSTKVPEDSGEEGGESSTVKEKSTSTTIRTPPSTEVPEVPPVMIPPPPENTKGGCGVRRVIPSGRIYSSNPSTSFGEFPWMVAVLVRNKGKRSEFHCGGSLISHNVVLTAAHCVHGYTESRVKVRAGDWDLRSRAEPEEREDRLVKKIIRHENFQPKKLINDVALLVLDDPLPRKIHIDTICLPEKGAQFAGQRCIATGWGAKQGGMINYTAVLSQVELPVLKPKECRDMLRKTILGRYFKLDKSFLCAGGEENNGACLQDGGGPLICESEKDSDRYYQAGIVSGGLACGVKDIPDLYANVAYFSDWIKAKLVEHGLDNEAIHP